MSAETNLQRKGNRMSCKKCEQAKSRRNMCRDWHRGYDEAGITLPAWSIDYLGAAGELFYEARVNDDCYLDGWNIRKSLIDNGR